MNISAIARKAISIPDLFEKEHDFTNATTVRVNTQTTYMTYPIQDKEVYSYDNIFDLILAGTPDEVKVAWEKTKEELDIKPRGLGVVINGQLIYELGIMPQMVVAQYNAGISHDGNLKTRPEDFLGKSVSSAIHAIKGVVDCVANSVEGKHLNHVGRQAVMVMHLTFLKHLEALETAEKI